MQKYVCEPCGYVYDPEVGDPDNGIAPGTAFEDLPEDWVCPDLWYGKRSVCGRVIENGRCRTVDVRHLFFEVSMSQSPGLTRDLEAVYNSQIRSLILPAIPLGL